MSKFQFRGEISKFQHGATGYSGENALVLADCAGLAYETEQTVKSMLTDEWHFDRVAFFTGPSTQAFIGGNEQMLIVTFRGTEPTNLNDWFRNLDAKFGDGAAGRVHRGFQRALREVWDGEEGLGATVLRFRDAGQPVWLSGHSLGGALATLAALELELKHHVPVSGLYTMGQPRVGNGTFSEALAAQLPDRCFRFVNNNDIVTRVPAWLYGYRHAGHRLYYDSQGNLLDDLSAWSEIRDSVQGVIGSTGGLRPDALADHDIETYTQLLERHRSTATRWS